MTRSPKLRNSLPDYHLNDTYLSTVTSFKYLGLSITNTLTWKEHVTHTTNKAARLLGFIWQVAGGCSSKAMLSLYLVLPVLEYGLPAWNLYTKDQCKRIEGVQRRASRMCLHQQRGDMPYEMRLGSLKIATVQDRSKFQSSLLLNVCMD